MPRLYSVRVALNFSIDDNLQCWKNLYETIDKIFLMSQYNSCIRRRVEQLAAHRAHNPGVVGSSPTPAINKGIKISSILVLFFVYENWHIVLLM